MKQTLEDIVTFWPWLALIVMIISWISTPRADRVPWPLRIVRVFVISLAIYLTYIIILPFTGNSLEYVFRTASNAVMNVTGWSLRTVVLGGIGGLLATTALWEYFSNEDKFPRLTHLKRRLRWRAEDFLREIFCRFRR
jgi:hypothetical protein